MSVRVDQARHDRAPSRVEDDRVVRAGQRGADVGDAAVLDRHRLPFRELTPLGVEHRRVPQDCYSHDMPPSRLGSASRRRSARTADGRAKSSI